MAEDGDTREALLQGREEQDMALEPSGMLMNKTIREAKTLWYIAGPAVFTMICQYSLGAITQVFAGHIGTIELAAVSIENSVIAGLAFGIMLGMGSALETLCGQAYGAGQLNMLGVYMQRSWIILNSTGLVLVLVYVFSPPILKLFGQTDEISNLAGKFAIWMIPQLFAYAMNFPIQKFLQSQSKVLVMAWISAGVLVLHVFFSWLFILKLGWGLPGAAITLNASWWLIIILELAYIFSGACPEAWTGFSWLAFKDLSAFIKLSLSSAVMLCLEFWYMMILIILTGHLKNPEIAVDSISICMNINGWEVMVPLGLNAAISVRVSNELGASHPNAAKFAVVVATTTSMVIGIVFAIILFCTRGIFPVLFTNSSEVMEATTKLANLLCVTILLNSVQPVLSGVAVGAGWQALVAYVNVICYYVFGIPLGCLLGYYFDFGTMGIWGGMIAGLTIQTIVLIIITVRTDWNKEASQAEDRIKTWGGAILPGSDDVEKEKDVERSQKQEFEVVHGNLKTIPIDFQCGVEQTAIDLLGIYDDGESNDDERATQGGESGAADVGTDMIPCDDRKVVKCKEPLANNMSQIFSTCKVFISRDKFVQWCRDTGAKMNVVMTTKRSQSDSIYQFDRIYLGCERIGLYRKRDGPIKKDSKQRKEGTQKCDSSFLLYGYQIGAQAWKLEVKCGSHNHPISIDFIGHAYVARLHDDETVLLKELVLSGVSPRDVLVLLKNWNPDSKATINTIYNAIKRMKLDLYHRQIYVATTPEDIVRESICLFC